MNFYDQLTVHSVCSLVPRVSFSFSGGRGKKSTVCACSKITVYSAIFIRDTNNCHKYTIRLLTYTVQFHGNLQWFTITQNLGNFRACADSVQGSRI